MSGMKDLRDRLEACPEGHPGWKEFENVCIDTLTFLFVPPLQRPKIQKRVHSGTDIRDAIFPNRNISVQNNWGHLLKELDARMILFEFKNYDKTEIGKDETVQTRSYMTATMGRLAIMCCNRIPNDAAHEKRNSIYTQDKNLILFLTKEHLLEMLFIRERGDDPSDLLMDLVEDFYMQHA